MYHALLSLRVLTTYVDHCSVFLMLVERGEKRVTARKKSPVVPIFFSRPACRVSTFQGVETRDAGVFVFSARSCAFRFSLNFCWEKTQTFRSLERTLYLFINSLWLQYHISLEFLWSTALYDLNTLELEFTREGGREGEKKAEIKPTGSNEVVDNDDHTPFKILICTETFMERKQSDDAGYFLVGSHHVSAISFLVCCDHVSCISIAPITSQLVLGLHEVLDHKCWYKR